MVGFGEQLGEEQVQDWRFAYLNYEALKQQIDLIEEARQRKEKLETAKLMFQRHVDAEITSIVDFYQVKLVDIQRKILYLQNRKHQLAIFLKDFMRTKAEQLVAVEEELQLWRQVAQEVKNLMDFVALNLAGIRKIEKKFIKNFGEVNRSKIAQEMNVSFEIQHPHEDKLFYIASFLSGKRIEGLGKMQQMSELNEAKEIIARTMAQLHGRRIYLTGANDSVAGEVQNEIAQSMSGRYQNLANLSNSSSEGLSAVQGLEKLGEIGEDDAVDEAWKELMEKQKQHTSNTKVPTLGPAVSSVGDYESVIMEMINAERRAQKESSLYRLNDYLAAQAGIFTPAPADDVAVATSLGLFLNLLCALLYMTNYNFVIPLINPLCRQLKQPSSTGGIIVGFADITAMAAAFIYSSWTNRQFKVPLLFSCFMLMISNVLFALSYDIPNNTLGLVVVLIARLFTGIGCARSLNRRYIADFVSVKNRTKLSAAFVAASAAGMSLGPLLALPLSAIPEQTHKIGALNLTLNDVTMGGYIMLLAWIVFYIAAALLFEEPTRKLNKVLIQKTFRQSTDNDSTRPLLQGNGQESEQEKDEEKAIVHQNIPPKYVMWKDPAVLPVGVCLLMLFTLKLTQQGTISSTPIFETPLTHNQWRAAEVGLYLALVNLAMLPSNFLVAAVSPYMTDRLIMLISIVVLFVGCTVLLTIKGALWPLTMARYLVGTIPILISTLGLECVSMSLMSKKISPEMATGTWNAGLLSTIGGSVGRFIGNIGITLLGRISSDLSGYPLRSYSDNPEDIANAIEGVTYFSNLIFGIFDIVVIISIVLYFVAYRSMSVQTH